MFIGYERGFGRFSGWGGGFYSRFYGWVGKEGWRFDVEAGMDSVLGFSVEWFAKWLLVCLKCDISGSVGRIQMRISGIRRMRLANGIGFVASICEANLIE